jgi:glycosyltransferase involved in cell wall biosynthesis
MIKIYDCSNSAERPENRGNGGPVENDVMRYLKENAHEYDCIFTENSQDYDLLITNDVFPEKFYTSPLPKLKRMDGIFFQEQYRKRNIPLNEAAKEADHVIFISEFSKQSYEAIETPLKSSSVALNQVDPNVFKSRYPSLILMSGPISFISIANDWSREEKRFNDILNFAKVIDGVLFLIGKIPEGTILPDNVTSFGYKNDPVVIAGLINYADAFVNFSYKDAAPKTVLQGLYCGLPVLYANSGGLPELAEGYGLGIGDTHRKGDELFIPHLVSDPDVYRMIYNKFKKQFPKYKGLVLKRDNESKFKQMLDEYFFHIRRLVNES